MIFYFFFGMIKSYFDMAKKSSPPRSPPQSRFSAENTRITQIDSIYGRGPISNKCICHDFLFFFFHDKYILTWQKNHHDHHDHHHDPDFQPKTLELHKLTPYMGGV